MRAGYFAEQEELIEDMEKYNEKLKQLYIGIQLLGEDPKKSTELIKDSLQYFEEFREKHDKKDSATTIDLDGTAERLQDYFDKNLSDMTINLQDLDLSKYDFDRFSRRRKERDRNKRGGSTITWYEWGEDFEPLDIGDLFDLAEEVADYGTGSGSSKNTANDSDRSDFFDFVDNLDMSGFKNYEE